MAAWDEQPAAGGMGECSALVRSSEALRFSAPEVAVQLARRALIVGAAEQSGTCDVDQAKGLSMRAQAVLAAGLVRISNYVDAVEPAFAALALAEGAGVAEVAMSVRLDLAACSREVGEPLLGCAFLRPVLEDAEPRPSVRAIALGRLVGCITHVGRRDDIEDALAEADRLLGADDGLSPDARRLERARLSVRTAAYHRWYGDTEDAVNAAREGLAQLSRLRGLRAESDRLRAQLALELVCALLDEGELAEAVSASEDVLAGPVRATSAAAVGALMLAVSTRVHLPAGRVDRGRGLLDQAVWVADRHGLDGLLADALTEVSRLDESAGHPTEALESLRSARAAEQRRLHAIARASRQVLTGVGATDWDAKAVNALLRHVVHPAGGPITAAPAIPAQPAAGTTAGTTASTASTATPATSDAIFAVPAQQPSWQSHRSAAADAEPSVGELASAAADGVPRSDTTDEATGLLNKEGLIRRLRSVRNGERPVALTLVRLENNGKAANAGDPAKTSGTTADFELSELVGRVRNIAPDNAELARSDGTELAVLLPHTTRDQAEKFAAAIESAWMGEANGQSISTGVVQSNPDAPAVDARALLTAARHALTPAAEPKKRPGERTQPLSHPLRTVEALAELEDVGDTLRIGRAIISSLSIPTGSGGKRRADPSERPAKPTRPVGETGGYRSASTLRPVPDDAAPGHRSASSLRPVTDTPTPDAVASTPAGHRSFSSLRPVTDEPAPTGSSAAQPDPSQSSAATGETSGSRFASAYEPPGTTPGDRATPAAQSPGDAPGAPEPAASHTPGAAAPPTSDAASGRADGAADYGSSTYEQTRTELARMMSALNAGGLPPISDSRSTPLPAPARPADDHMTNGSALLRQSIPTPPDPDEIPEPPTRPDVPDPDGPEPAPRTPPDPAPPSPAEPAPLSPPSTTTGPTSTDGAGSPFGGGAADADEVQRKLFGTSRRTTGHGAADAASYSSTGTDTAPVASAGTAHGAADVAPTGPSGAASGGGSFDAGDGLADPGSDGEGRDTAVAGGATSGDTGVTGGVGHRSWRRGRGERSSATIAGLLAEALAAYQETEEQQQQEQAALLEREEPPHREPAAEHREPAAPLWEPAEPSPETDFGAFDRLLDWHHQYPASGRHRSPE
ncbi:MAG: hypothetical protein GEV28_30110 [Actinophytocola sp.]|uniref:hypothetical protein n=1 Tax=Actinophytocola sp. TaxID=1872138 RepID=UPI00132474DF|nr:hypothetical protein [Actinophytocola sp.]MPZ84417.1 hypothetical protein [Actinophytocola sp.]